MTTTTEVMAIFIRRTLTRTNAPMFSSFSQIVPEVASAKTLKQRDTRDRPTALKS